jgi:hypothetical protein
MKTKIRIHVPAATTLGKIEYLHHGNVVDVTEYKNEAEFIQDIQDEIRFQVPIRVTLYRNRYGRTTASYALRQLEGPHCEENVQYITL